MRYFAKTFLVGIGLLWIPTGVTAQDPAKIAEGARTWAQNCTRCHNARSPLERNDSDWAIIVGHMRARANLTKGQAQAVAVYLQVVNAPEGTPAPLQIPEREGQKARDGRTDGGAGSENADPGKDVRPEETKGPPASATRPPPG